MLRSLAAYLADPRRAKRRQTLDAVYSLAIMTNAEIDALGEPEEAERS